MYREKVVMDSEHCRPSGNARGSDACESGWKSTTELPTGEYYVQIR